MDALGISLNPEDPISVGSFSYKNGDQQSEQHSLKSGRQHAKGSNLLEDARSEVSHLSFVQDNTSMRVLQTDA